MNFNTLVVFAIILLTSCSGERENIDITIPPADILAKLAFEESAISIHPGIPGQIPFWNTFSERFIYAPSFDFPETEGADKYRYTIIREDLNDTLVFYKNKPWYSFPEEWSELTVGPVHLMVEAVKNGLTIARSGERHFYRASPYQGPYHKKKMDYTESAKWLFSYLYNAPYIQYWLEHEKPDPTYGLYGYPAKMFSAVIKGMISFSELTENAKEKRNAIRIAGIVADYMLSISEKEDAPMAYFPPTYTGPIYADMVNEYRGESLADRMMLIYPATAGQAYLRLYNTTEEQKYLEAAVNIASTYEKIQLINGTWHLLVYYESNEPVSPNYVMPTGVVSLLETLVKEYGYSEFTSCAEKAKSWMKQNVVEEFNWEGQFEDQVPSSRYKNLSKGQACSYALSLLKEANSDSSKIWEAEEIIRFAEDQFVVWENPIQGDKIKSETWILPCALEQYTFFTPVNSSSADMITAFMTAYDKTKNIIYLVKAMELANTILYAQNEASGQYPTYLRIDRLDQEGWINCMVHAAETVVELDNYLKNISPDKEIQLEFEK